MCSPKCQEKHKAAVREAGSFTRYFIRSCWDTFAMLWTSCDCHGARRADRAVIDFASGKRPKKHITAQPIPIRCPDWPVKEPVKVR